MSVELKQEAQHLIVCDNLVKIYKTGSLEIVALQGLDLHVDAAEMVGIVGKSGSGKSTLLNILGGNDVPTTGSARVAGYELATLTAKQAEAYRRHTVGVVWQQTARNMLPYLSARQNVEQPLYYAGVRRSAARQRATELLDAVGLSHRTNHLPADLSGGEQQRVAIAIAMANSPRVILADEPTGELDSATAQDILGVLRAARDDTGVTVVAVTHDPAVADVADRMIAIRDGRTSTERVRSEPLVRSAGAINVTDQEFVVVDRAGRLQLPADYIHALGIEDRVVLRLEEGRIILEPARSTKAPPV
jgi:putative ABC transport system ATP-binding protein